MPFQPDVLGVWGVLPNTLMASLVGGPAPCSSSMAVSGALEVFSGTSTTSLVMSSGSTAVFPRSSGKFAL